MTVNRVLEDKNHTRYGPESIQLRKKIKSRGLNTLIEIDGGIHENNIEYLASCGASVVLLVHWCFR